MDNNYGTYPLDGTEDFEVLRKNPSQLSKSESSASASTRSSRGLRPSLLIGLGLWLVIMVFELSPVLLIASTGGSTIDTSAAVDDEINSDDDDALHALWGSAAYLGVYTIRPCSVDECLQSPCGNPRSAPFACLALRNNEGVRGGCGSTPWTREICSDQCDATVCAGLLERAAIQSHLRSPHHCEVDCPKHWCKRNRLCGDASAPYQCTEGNSMYGCSADRFEWTLRSADSECSSCCKTTSCDS